MQTQPTPGVTLPAIEGRLSRQGALSFLELPATDINASADFYHRVVGWTSDSEGPDRSKFSDPVGFLIWKWILGRAPSREPGILPFICVYDVHRAVQDTLANHGELVQDPYREGNLVVAIIRDPAGNTIGLWQAGDESRRR